eukprot:9475692-Pyramimonas_sp.AAC.1
MVPSPVTARPSGRLNIAAVPTPSSNPVSPFPASVLTTPAQGRGQGRWFRVNVDGIGANGDGRGGKDDGRGVSTAIICDALEEEDFDSCCSLGPRSSSIHDELNDPSSPTTPW